MDSVKVKIMETGSGEERGGGRRGPRLACLPAALDMGGRVIKMASEGGGPQRCRVMRLTYEASKAFGSAPRRVENEARRD